jgi:UDP-N-acetylmuramoyl-tripeptide--D-alanyl-D-alanine ligase
LEKLTLAEISSLCQGRLSSLEDTQRISKNIVCRVTTDSRDVREGDLFVALKGERFNGHDFLEQIAEKKAMAAVVEVREMQHRKSRIPMILVEDSVKGFQSLARNYRDRLSVRTVAVAGSNGKTGTKEMVAAVLGTQFCTLKNEGNLNNHIGVPMSVMRLDKNHEVGVFEIGTNHPGELVPLLEMIRPLAGVVTTIGEEHLEFFHDLEGVANEEGTVADFLPTNGLLVLNADDSWSASISKRTASRISYFGFDSHAHYRAEDVELNASGTRFRLITPKGKIQVELKLLGRHQVSNALAAVAVGEFFGISLEKIVEGLTSVKPAKMRMEPRVMKNGVFVIHDAYNANPSSMRAALNAFRELKSVGRKIAVLGEMRELGEVSESAHREIGNYVFQSGIDVLVIVGKAARPIIEGCREVQKPPFVIEFFEDTKSAGSYLRGNAKSNDMVLLKASRGVALENVLEGWESI